MVPVVHAHIEHVRVSVALVFPEDSSFAQHNHAVLGIPWMKETP